MHAIGVDAPIRYHIIVDELHGKYVSKWLELTIILELNVLNTVNSFNIAPLCENKPN